MGFVASSPNFIAGDVTITDGNVTLDNNKFYKGNIAAGGAQNLMGLTGTDAVSILNGSGKISFASSSSVEFISNLFGTPRRLYLQTDRVESDWTPQTRCVIDGTAVPADVVANTDDNVASITDNGVGDYDVVHADDFNTAAYVTLATPGNAASHARVGSQLATDVQIYAYNSAGTLTDMNVNMLSVGTRA